MASINLNSEITVKLTEFGYKIWLNQADVFAVYGSDAYQRHLKKISSKINSEGYLTTTFAELMNVFGPFIYRELPFEDMTVFISDENINNTNCSKKSYNLKNQIGNQLK